ncbi:MAG: hypothetical protein CMO44_15835 [Verrucomicrobiales bacterium]|nr:hypothetical protein [Verrucomicrobiales bacterium]|tara:strand:+ start:8414 stop:8725 length:312 start_codon:yes stop_codon:yes gene_type:complete
MADIKITKDGVSNTISGSMAFAQEAYPTSEGYSHEDVTPTLTSEEVTEEKELQARNWRDSELYRTDSLSLLTDHPKKTEIAAYRVKLRDWPSTSDFPDTRPTL